MVNFCQLQPVSRAPVFSPVTGTHSCSGAERGGGGGGGGEPVRRGLSSDHDIGTDHPCTWPKTHRERFEDLTGVIDRCDSSGQINRTRVSSSCSCAWRKWKWACSLPQRSAGECSVIPYENNTPVFNLNETSSSGVLLCNFDQPKRPTLMKFCAGATVHWGG